jgi:hypothetical protein
MFQLFLKQKSSLIKYSTIPKIILITLFFLFITPHDAFTRINLVSTMNLLEAVQAKLTAGKIKEALADVQKALEKSPEDLDTKRAAASVHYARMVSAFEGGDTAIITRSSCPKMMDNTSSSNPTNVKFIPNFHVCRKPTN